MSTVAKRGKNVNSIIVPGEDENKPDSISCVVVSMLWLAHVCKAYPVEASAGYNYFISERRACCRLQMVRSAKRATRVPVALPGVSSMACRGSRALVAQPVGGVFMAGQRTKQQTFWSNRINYIRLKQIVSRRHYSYESPKFQRD